MFKRLRQMYWYQRDRGKGGRFKLFCAVVILSVISVVGLGARNIWLSRNTVQDKKTETASGSAAASGSGVSSGAVSGSEISIYDSPAPETENEAVSGSATGEAYVVDTSGMTSFLGFMTDESYEKLINQIKEKCRASGTNTAKKLDYQKFGATEYDVISYVLLGDGKIVECDYNLKGDILELKDTALTEESVEQMSLDEKKAAEEELKKEQEESAKKAAKAKKDKKSKKSSKKKKSTKGGKTSSKRKSKKKK